MTLARGLFGLMFATTLLASQTSSAQTVSGERFRPSTTSAGVIDVESGAVAEHLSWNAALWTGYAYDPLVIYQGNERLGALVNHRVGADAVFSIGLFDWLELAADLPIIAFQSADQGSLDPALTNGLSAFGLGDMRLAPKVRLLRASEQLVDLAIIPALTLPSGAPAGESFTGEGQFTFLPEVAVSRRFNDGALSGLTIAGNALARIRPEERVLINTSFSHELVGRLGVGYRLHELLGLPLEVDASTSVGTPLLSPFVGDNVTGAEVMGGVKYDVLTLPAAAGAGDGFILQAFGGVATGGFGAGTPLARVFLGVRGEKPADIDHDDDWVKDSEDRCPNEPEDKDGFEDNDGCADVAGPAENKGCPWPDTDGDGILDKDDACVDVKGVEALKGCPDQDSDGITDADDACPALAGPKEPYAGCPDTDGDGFTDDKDKCPNEAETVNNVDDDDGCPDQGKVLVSLTKDKIEILDKVFFDTGKATIQAKSFPLLDQVATIMRSHKEIAHVRVEGHTDDQGPDDKNLTLSQARADAVKQYLLDKGIDAARVESLGLGESRPAVEGTSAAAREQNRRVEFVIVH